MRSSIYDSEQQYKQINFSDADCIKGLIKNRWIIDPYYGLDKVDRDYHSAGDGFSLNQELICIFVALDDLIIKANLNDKQTIIVKMLMRGDTFEEIASDIGSKTRTIERILDTIAQKIKKVNDDNWKYEFIHLNYLKVNWDYKECSKCKEFKPKTVDFFRKHPITKDGFQSQCRRCELI